MMTASRGSTEPVKPGFLNASIGKLLNRVKISTGVVSIARAPETVPSRETEPLQALIILLFKIT